MRVPVRSILFAAAWSAIQPAAAAELPQVDVVWVVKM
jgi:hypothetical protein